MKLKTLLLKSNKNNKFLKINEFTGPAIKAPVMSLNGRGSPAVKNMVKHPPKK